MNAKQIEKRGRKKLPKDEKIKPLTIWVKAKNLPAATEKAAIIETKYR